MNRSIRWRMLVLFCLTAGILLLPSASKMDLGGVVDKVE